MLPARAEVHDNIGLPGYVLVSHEWWHQVEARARLFLRLDNDDTWPPRNHDVLRVGNERYDPRSWVSSNPQGVLAWYRTVLGALPPEFWRDAWRRPERIAEDADNLARSGYPWTTGVYGGDALTDTVLSFGSYMRPVAADDAKEVWFGVHWDAPVQMGRLVVHAPGTWAASATVEVHDDDGWTRVDARWSDGTWTFAPVEGDGIRLVPTTRAKGLTCQEIEVYAE
jgi:hypothetical protein